jgi:hypothetical protein
VLLVGGEDHRLVPIKRQAIPSLAGASSKLTTVKVLDKWSSSSGVEYKCEFEPLWLAADLAERAQMGRIHIRRYENGLVRDRRLKTLRVGKRKFSEMQVVMAE